jgi:hypothetical protein
MSLAFLFAACLFVLVLGAVVACIDRWRDARLTVARPVQRVGVPVVPIPAARKRAA